VSGNALSSRYHVTCGPISVLQMQSDVSLRLSLRDNHRASVVTCLQNTLLSHRDLLNRLSLVSDNKDSCRYSKICDSRPLTTSRSPSAHRHTSTHPACKPLVPAMLSVTLRLPSIRKPALVLTVRQLCDLPLTQYGFSPSVSLTDARLIVVLASQ
jgi:hypothetical protein